MMDYVGRIITFDAAWAFDKKEQLLLAASYNVEFIVVTEYALKNNYILCNIISNERKRVSEIFKKNDATYEESISELDHTGLRKNDLLEGLTRSSNLKQFNILAVFLGKNHFPTNRKVEDIAPFLHHCIAGCNLSPPFYAINGKGNIQKQVIDILSKYLRVNCFYNQNFKPATPKDIISSLPSDLFIKIGPKLLRIHYKDETLSNSEIQKWKQHIHKLFLEVGMTHYFLRKNIDVITLTSEDGLIIKITKKQYTYFLEDNGASVNIQLAS